MFISLLELVYLAGGVAVLVVVIMVVVQLLTGKKDQRPKDRDE
jgi:hypothetical protein